VPVSREKARQLPDGSNLQLPVATNPKTLACDDCSLQPNAHSYGEFESTLGSHIANSLITQGYTVTLKCRQRKYLVFSRLRSESTVGQTRSCHLSRRR
jgi:hypothetical protein